MTLDNTDVARLIDSLKNEIRNCMAEIKMEKLLAPKELAKELGCSRSTVDRTIKTKKLGGTKVGKLKKYTISEFIK